MNTQATDGENIFRMLLSDKLFTSKMCKQRDFPGGPVVKTSPSNAGDAGSIPGPGAKIPHASWPKQNV